MSTVIRDDIGHPLFFRVRGNLSEVQGERIVARQKRPKGYSAMQTAIGERIRWARELVEPNRAAFARVLEVDRTTLQKIEDGDRAPSVFLVIEIAHRLRVSTDYILLGSLRGVDGEMAARLLQAHPMLHESNGTATDPGSNPPPRRRGQMQAIEPLLRLRETK